MKRIISLVCSMTLLLSIFTIGANAVVAVDPVAAYIQNGISLTSGKINGNAYLGGNFTANNATDNLMSGDVYKGPSAAINFAVPSQFSGDVYDVQEADFPSALPVLSVDTSGIPAYAEQDYTIAWWPLRSDLTTSYSFNNIVVNNVLTIDTTAGDVVLVTNTLSGTGTINIKGSNRVAIIVKNSISGGIRTESTVNQDNFYLFIQNGNYASPTYGNLAATIVMNTGAFNVSGSLTFNGVVISGNSSMFTITGATVNAQYYTPNADVQVTSGATLNGMIEANSLVVSGAGKINYANGYVTLPSAFFGASSSNNPVMVLPSDVVTPSTYVSGLKAEYYDTSTMTNSSAKRLEKQVGSPNLNYGYNSPDSTIDPDTFSISFTGYIKPTESGSYTFYTYSDDGVKLQINGGTLLDRLEDISLEFTAGTPTSLVSGDYYPFELSYYDNTLNSTMFLFYEKDGGDLSLVPDSWYYSGSITPTQYFNSVSASGSGLNISYYNDANGVTSGTGYVTTTTGNIFMAVGAGSPYSGVNEDNFSVLYEGYIESRNTEDLTLEFIVDDGLRVYINDELKINEWHGNSNAVYSVTFSAQNATKYKIRVEYNDLYAGATCRMFWHSDSFVKEAVPLKYLYNS